MQAIPGSRTSIPTGTRLMQRHRGTTTALWESIRQDLLERRSAPICTAIVANPLRQDGLKQSRRYWVTLEGYTLRQANGMFAFSCVVIVA